jgi:hypothetical protein
MEALVITMPSASGEVEEICRVGLVFPTPIDRSIVRRKEARKAIPVE